MSSDTLLHIAGIVILVIYFVRRMYWLGKANRHNLLGGEAELADQEVNKSHDVLSWVLLLAGALLIL
jgi:hypothetical protein